ncbi:MAG TPA: TetR family transcriptional regulator [Mycobacteriales bacterium]|nr:TetR family transcriptional regulator [Mycobacteriales bacterium]
MTAHAGREAAGRTRRARGSLSREEILSAAREVVERDGLRQLSMPTLAKHLKSGVASIYWYFKSKEELVDALAGLVLHDIHQQLPPAGDGAWDAELIAYFAAFRELLLSLPAYREIVAYAPGSIAHSRLTGAAQRRLGEGLHLLTLAGLSHQAATDAFAACLNFTRGFVTMEQGVTDGDAAQRTNAAPADTGSLSERDRDVAYLNEVGEQQFLRGLRLLVRGIRAEAEGG